MDPTRPTTLRLTASTLAVAALVSAPGFAAADSKDEEATETIIVTADRVPKFNDTRVDEREGCTTHFPRIRSCPTRHYTGRRASQNYQRASR